MRRTVVVANGGRPIDARHPRGGEEVGDGAQIVVGRTTSIVHPGRIVPEVGVDLVLQAKYRGVRARVVEYVHVIEAHQQVERDPLAQARLAVGDATLVPAPLVQGRRPRAGHETVGLFLPRGGDRVVGALLPRTVGIVRRFRRRRASVGSKPAGSPTSPNPRPWGAHDPSPTSSRRRRSWVRRDRR